MTEQEYRLLPEDSYSSIKVFLDDRKKYYKKFILNEEVPEDESDSLTFGDLVDCLRFTPDKYESKFTMLATQIPSGQYLKFCDALMKYTMYAINRETGEVTREMEAMMLDAYNSVKYDRNHNIIDFKRDSFDKVKENFANPEKGLKAYYDHCRNSIGKQVIDLTMFENANRLVANLADNFVTKEIINLKTDGDVKIFNQFPIQGELVPSLTLSVPYKLKCLVDKLIINRVEKRIYVYDLKTAWDNEQTFIHNILKYRYYFQGALYYYLVEQWRRNQRELQDYTTMYTKFIVAESTGYKNPLIYEMDENSFRQGMYGFNVNKSRHYVGVIKAVRDLQWHKENAVWNISKDNFVANGRIPFPIFE